MEKVFIEVTAYSSTTKLGKMVGDEVKRRFHHTIVSLPDGWNKMVDEIVSIKDVCAQRQPRCKPMILERSKWTEHYLCCRPEGGSYDSFAFTLTGKEVKCEIL